MTDLGNILSEMKTQTMVLMQILHKGEPFLSRDNLLFRDCCQDISLLAACDLSAWQGKAMAVDAAGRANATEVIGGQSIGILQNKPTAKDMLAIIRVQGRTGEQPTSEPKHICQTCGWWADECDVGADRRRCKYLNASHPEAPAQPDDFEAQLMTRVDFGCTEWKAST